MDYGAKENNHLISSEEDPVVRCTNCGQFFYENLGDKRDTYNLQLLYDEDDPEEDYPFKGCGNCKTDGYLMDL